MGRGSSHDPYIGVTDRFVSADRIMHEDIRTLHEPRRILCRHARAIDPYIMSHTSHMTSRLTSTSRHRPALLTLE